ncbi:MAG: hypothetical protein Q8S13_11870 [Dehalococcoidia bacterium]|nr:hypothetical protein [Dehalococcoidia bacterium]
MRAIRREVEITFRFSFEDGQPTAPHEADVLDQLLGLARQVRGGQAQVNGMPKGAFQPFLEGEAALIAQAAGRLRTAVPRGSQEGRYDQPGDPAESPFPCRFCAEPKPSRRSRAQHHRYCRLNPSAETTPRGVAATA